ncbi:MAG: cupin domain-containing protein [Anaerolineales bacterium]|nr:cupin domain-containing protein [Anaerolineales bacterium]
MKESRKPFDLSELAGGIQSAGLLAAQDVHVGARLRALRGEQGLSLRALAELSKLNVNTLSLIENGRTSPSVSTLQQIAQSLNVPIGTFFEAENDKKKVIFQKHNHRPRASFSHGNLEDLGSGMQRFGAEPLIITLNPHADSGRANIVHTGREFVYCLEGTIEYCVDENSYLLTEGDSLLFEAYLPHRWRNQASTPARMLLVLCPMDSRDQPVERHFGR